MNLETVKEIIIGCGVEPDSIQFQNVKENSATLRYKYWKFFSPEKEQEISDRLKQVNIDLMPESYDDDDGGRIRWLHSYTLKVI